MLPPLRNGPTSSFLRALLAFYTFDRPFFDFATGTVSADRGAIIGAFADI
jgi:hypothetical protein